MTITTRRVLMGGGFAIGGVAFLLTAMLMRDAPSNGDPSRRNMPSPEVDEAQEIESNHWVVPRHDKETYLSDLATVSKHILLKPEPGKDKKEVRALVVSRLTPDSPMYAVGFRTGDQILRVHGTPITTMKRAINLIHEVKESNDLTVQVRRGDVTIDYRFEFR